MGEDKKYLNYLSIENVFENTIQQNESYKVSYKTLSLYRKSHNEQNGTDQNGSDFFSIQHTGTGLSDIPFLGIIQISLCKDYYIEKMSQEKAKIDIDAFLNRCEERILELADKCCESFDESIVMRRALFRSLTTGDFCLAIRTNLIKLIYFIAVTLNGTQNDSKGCVKMLTFTNVGIECRYVEGKGYATLKKEVVDKNNDRIALRFSADESIRSEMKKFIEKHSNADVRMTEGLFGRYEYLLTIGMNEFADLYPFLCEKKFGRITQGRTQSKLERSLRKSFVRKINERILVEFVAETVAIESALKRKCENNFNDKEKAERKEIFFKNEILYRKIKDLENFKNIFQEEHFAFQDLIRGTKEIYKSFSSAGMDKESYINWCLFHRDMDILCECIRQMMDYYKKWVETAGKSETRKKWYRGIVLKDWRENLNAINRYTTLVQSVNYQTYQSPSYEIQTQIDTEKAMVAYREAMELYITDGIIWNGKREGEGESDASMVFPLIYPDLSKEKVTVTAPFMVKKPDGNMASREIICTVPSFEYFGRLYDLLPWIIHETSHHLRVTPREKRNLFVADYIFSYIFRALMREPLRQLSDYEFYGPLGTAEKYLISCMAKIAKEEISAADNFEKYNFEMLVLEIEKWVERMFPFGVGYDGETHMDEEEHLKKSMFDFWLDAYRREDMLNRGSLYEILKTLDDNLDLKVKEHLAENLLERYYKNLCEDLKVEEAEEFKVCIEDIKNDVRMEKKLIVLSEAAEEKRAAVREYYERIVAVYRIMQINLKDADKNVKRTEEYLQKVFDLYKKDYKSTIENSNTIVDTVSLHVMRNLGLLREKSGVFIEEMRKIVRNVNNSQVMEHKETAQRIYLEAYADILMATSLQLTSFGYCRQVLQTASDAKIMDREDEYEAINYQRWRTVAAVLLVKNNPQCHHTETDEAEVIDAADLIKDAKKYCEYTIRHISQKLSKGKEITLEGEGQKKLGEEEIKKREKRRELLHQLLNKVNRQMQRYLDTSAASEEDVLLLSVLLHGDKGIKEQKIKTEWETYKDAAEFCSDVKYNFWRLDCFCRGIVNIVQDGRIIVSKKLFDHMKKVREMIDEEGKYGCAWERDHDFLTDPRRDVGKFYNNPLQVYEKTPDQKLENTIDFIQNYYYYNRFRSVTRSDIVKNNK